MKTKLIVILGMLISPAALASSANAWQDHDAAVKSACIKASSLSKARAVGNIHLFDDRAGFSALLIEGVYPQKQMKNQRGRELCLYQRTSKQAFIAEADDLQAIEKR